MRHTDGDTAACLPSLVSVPSPAVECTTDITKAHSGAR
jgi:hypothetical protein